MATDILNTCDNDIWAELDRYEDRTWVDGEAFAKCYGAKELSHITYAVRWFTMVNKSWLKETPQLKGAPDLVDKFCSPGDLSSKDLRNMITCINSLRQTAVCRVYECGINGVDAINFYNGDNGITSVTIVNGERCLLSFDGDAIIAVREDDLGNLYGSEFIPFTTTKDQVTAMAESIHADICRQLEAVNTHRNKQADKQF